MCGIAGIYDRERSNDPDALSRMLDVQLHRGPDGSGAWAEPGIDLGHRRLSILDLSEDGAQPMAYGDGRYMITYNGEVYNYIELREELVAAGHRFRSTCDTEVLLAAYAEWGDNCLHRFNGMFAFAIWDRRERRLFCARDRLGVKPFAYTWDGRRFAFASEVKALLAGGFGEGGMDADAVYEYLVRGYTTGGRSFHAGVRALEPGHTLVLEEGRSVAIREWWTPNREVDPGDRRTRDEWAEEVAEVLDDAVRLRLRSDVPVGAHLSGGLDSSAVVAAAARHGGADVHTFTGAFTDDAASDERGWARQVAGRYGLRMHEVEISVDGLADQFERILWHMDEPIAGPGVFPQMLVCDLARASGFTVALGGQGGDELFGGYLRHRALHWRRTMRSGAPLARAGAFVELSRLAAGEWSRVRRTATRTGDDRLSPSFLAQVDPGFRAEVRRGVFSYESARDLMWHDLRCYLPALLQVEDRTSMAASIESRTPLLDWRLVELSLRAPTSVLFAPQDPKPLLRRAVREWLPAEVVGRRDKKGFPTPLHYWQERPQLGRLVHALTDRTDAAGDEAARWQAPAASSGRAVFGDAYLQQPEALQASELWSVLTINGWLARLDSGATSAPVRRAA